jgi:hypothetical protein
MIIASQCPGLPDMPRVGVELRTVEWAEERTSSHIANVSDICVNGNVNLLCLIMEGALFLCPVQLLICKYPRPGSTLPLSRAARRGVFGIGQLAAIECAAVLVEAWYVAGTACN